MLGSPILPQLAFRWEKRHEFPMDKIPTRNSKVFSKKNQKKPKSGYVGQDGHIYPHTSWMGWRRLDGEGGGRGGEGWRRLVTGEELERDQEEDVSRDER